MFIRIRQESAINEMFLAKITGLLISNGGLFSPS